MLNKTAREQELQTQLIELKQQILNAEALADEKTDNYNEALCYINQAKACLTALGAAWRGDWSDFDGRTLRDQLDDIQGVLSGGGNAAMFCAQHGIATDGSGWTTD